MRKWQGRMALAALGVTVGVAGGCVPRGLGDEEKDTRKVGEQPELRHLADALRGGGGFKVMDLFHQRNLNFKNAPDPSAVLSGYLDANNTRNPAGAQALSVMSFNVALLEAKPFGINYAVSPKLEVRRHEMPRLVMGTGNDIILLQEAWHDPDLQRFKDQAPGMGYRLVAQDRGQYTDGLIILVKESILADGSSVEMDNVPYDAQQLQEYWPGPRVKRGYLYAKVQHRTLGTLHLFDTHMQAYPENWMGRMQQARQLGLRVQEVTSDGDVALVAGDMNAGPYYVSDTWRTPDGRPHGDWWRNAISWALLLYYAGGADVMSAASEAQDVFLGRTVVNNWRQSTSVPGASPGWCDATPAVVFTATDCNSLYFRQYAGTEYPARLDHLVLVDRSQRVYVAGAGLEFVAPQQWPDGQSYEVSDHYGMSASLMVQPAP